MRTLLLASALALSTASPAQAARLTTPIYTQDSGGIEQCRLSYFGQQTNLPVRVTVIGYADAGPLSQSRIIRTFKMGPNNRGVQIAYQCDQVGGDLSCDNFRCVFEIPNTTHPSHFVGNACGWPDAAGNYCKVAK